MKRTAVAFICDANFAMPTSVAVESMKHSRKSDTHYVVYIVTTGLLPEDQEKFALLADEHLEIHVREVSIEKYARFEKTINQTMSNVSTTALLKFDLPNIIPEETKLLYLDGDILVKDDLSDVFLTDIEGAYVGGVLDSSSMYAPQELPVECPQYFNSGVMLLNLQKMREENVTETLIKTKTELADVRLMDQNVFNIVMVDHIVLLPIRYNFMYTNLLRSELKYTMDQLNEMFGTQYADLNGILEDAAIIHFTSKDAPWKTVNMPLQDAWFDIFNMSPFRSRFGCEPDTAPVVSIIITETDLSTKEHIKQTLRSIAQQKYASFETVLVSSLVSPEKLHDLIGDNNITIVPAQSANKNLCFRQGVEAARGTYIMWLECGNTIVCDALIQMEEFLASEADHEVIYYNTNVIRIRGLEAPAKLIEKGTDITRGTFTSESVWTPMIKNSCCFPVLWNALTKKDVYVKIFDLITEQTWTSSGFDLIAVCLRNIFAVRHYSTQKALYEYHFNCNMDIRDLTFDPEWFRGLMDVLEYKDRLCGICDEQILQQAMDFMQYIIVKFWVQKSPMHDASAIFDMMWDMMGMRVIEILAFRFVTNTQEIAQKIQKSRFMKEMGTKPIKIIGLFFHNIYNGGIQRVLVQLAKIFSNHGYRIVVFTDEEPAEGEYPLPENVIRHVLPDSRIFRGESYGVRARELYNAFHEYQIDLFINNAWSSYTLAFDTIIAKICGVKVVSLAHSISALWFSEVRQPMQKTEVYKLLDGVVTLSRVEEEFFSQFTTARYIPNPCSFDNIEEIKVSPLTTNNILWLARMHTCKNPEHLLNAFAQILKKVPDATISYVGGGDDMLTAQLMKMAQWYGVEDRVAFAGFTLDVEQYYYKSSVFVMTSYHEGYPMTLTESKSFGVPVVVYDMPYLEMLRENKGMIIVERGNIMELADAIADLLLDRNKLQQMGAEARASVEPITNDYIMDRWNEMFEQIGHPSAQYSRTKQIMLENIMEYHELGIEKFVENATSKLTKDHEKLQKDYKELTQLRVQRWQEMQGLYKERSQLHRENAELRNERSQLHRENAELRNELDTQRNKLNVPLCNKLVKFLRMVKNYGIRYAIRYVYNVLTNM